eukprot:541652-Alexandrium_andersonii.AAC.1
MSASLVGSEMCIRDSRRAPPAPGRRRRFLGWGVLGAVAPRERAGRKPVSYTHLTLPTICSV